MTKPFFLSEKPLERFGDIYKALLDHKRWSDDISALRYSALTLVAAEGEAGDVARRLFALADRLKESAGWFGSLNSAIRFAVAAVLLRSESDPAAFTAEVDRVTQRFRDQGMRRGATYELLAVRVLQQGGAEALGSAGQRHHRSQVLSRHWDQ